MKKIYTFLLILVLLFSCGVAKNTPSDSPQSHMFTQIERVYTIDQFDSLCFTDRIHRNLDKWGSTNFIDDKGTPTLSFGIIFMFVPIKFSIGLLLKWTVIAALTAVGIILGINYIPKLF